MTAVQREAIQSPATGLQTGVVDCNGGETQILMAVFGVIAGASGPQGETGNDGSNGSDGATGSAGSANTQVQPITLSNLQEQQLVAFKSFDDGTNVVGTTTPAAKLMLQEL
jgi:hypothetical protein